jgi:hypothetical protein
MMSFLDSPGLAHFENDFLSAIAKKVPRAHEILAYRLCMELYL